MIGIVRKSNKDRILTIIVDSVAAASTKVELESDHGKDGFATGKSIIISKAMRKITNMIGKQKVLTVFTNQSLNDLYFDGVKVFLAPGLASNTALLTQTSNLFFATGLMSDLNEVKVLDMSDLDGSQNVRVIMRFTADAKYGFASDCVTYGITNSAN